jgi:flagellar assembly protein FliH
VSAGSPFAFEQLAPPPPRPVRPASPDDPVAAAAAARAAAEREATELRALAREQGYREGIEAARAETEAALRALAAALEGVEAERARSAGAVEREAVELALALADKVLASALEVRPELVVEVVEGTLRRLVERERIVVLVHPDDVELVRAAADSLGTIGSVERLDVQAERRVPRGGAILRTPAGEIDARVGSQLERAREVLLAELGG